MKPDRFDHNDALRACQSISEKSKEEELSHELNILNQVAGAWACNTNCPGISRAQYQQALDKVTNA